MSFTCMIFTETWLTPERDKIFNIPGFYCYDIYRNQYGLGIKMYLKDCIQSRILECFTVINDLLEILTVELFYGGFKFILMSVSPSFCMFQKKILSLSGYLLPICITC